MTCRLCKRTGLKTYEIEITRGNESMVTFFHGTDEDDARKQAERAYFEYTIADCREVGR